MAKYKPMTLKNAKVSLLVFLLLGATTQMFAANPTVTNVKVLGDALYNSTPNPDQMTTLTGEYTYDDADGDAEGATTFQWYRSLASDGTGLTAIGGATAKRYTLTSGDIGYYLYFAVTPVDANGDIGTTVTSAAGDLVTASSFTDQTFSSTTISSNQDYMNASISGNNRTITVTGSGVNATIHGDFDMGSANGTTINVTNGATLRISGAMIIRNNLTVNVDATSTFIIESGLIAKNGAALSVSGILEVTGDVDVEQNATFTVASGGSLDVGGDFTSGDNGTLTIEGDATIGGNMTVGDNTTIAVDLNADGTGSLDIGGDLTAGNGSVITGSGPVTVAGDVNGPPGFASDSQLPIELYSFRVVAENGTVMVIWQTLSETNNEWFVLERSANGVDYEEVARVAGAGNSDELLTYRWEDKYPLTGRSFYRLRQTDYDGQEETFEAASLQNGIAARLAAYPNPASTNVSVIWSGEGNGILRVLDLSGNVQVERILDGTLGNREEIDLSDFAAGVYLVQIHHDGEYQALRLMVR